MSHSHTALIDRYLAGAAQLRAAVRGLTDAQLDAFPVPGTWSIRQIVVHLLHAEIFLVARMLQIAAEDTPLVMNWEENEFMGRLHYEAVPVAAALTAFDGLRASTAATLRTFADADFARAGIHSKAGKVTVLEMLDKACWHFEHHLKFVEKKRMMLEGVTP